MSRASAFILGALATMVTVFAAACSDGPTYAYEGVVVDTTGAPVVGATIQIEGEEAQSGTDGGYELTAGRPDAWVQARADGFLSRTRPSRHDDPLLVRLTPAVDETVSMHFTGDVMAGRRFYDRDEDGDASDGHLTQDPSLEQHSDLLAHIEPLLADADLTVVNLETPLTAEPWYDVNGPRPDTFHPTKDFAFSSHPLLARALADAGVDAVDLGNNHLYDRLEAGVADTIRILDDAGIVHYGAGSTIEEAWEPALITRKGQTIALLGCTSISGEEHEIVYVATEDQGGAAPCQPDLLEEAVKAATARADVVVVSIHGGFEYGAEPSDRVASLTERARAAGARLVVNHHPHVVGGIDWDGSTVVAENMGNFLFDQTIWQTFPGYVFRAELREGEVVRAYAEPIVVADYLPRGLTGNGAAHVQRIAAGLGGSDVVMEDGAIEVDIHGAVEAEHRTVEVDDAGQLVRIAAGAEVVGIDATAVRLGRDILRVGDFEDHQVGDDDSHHSYWELQRGRDVGPELGRQDTAGAQITRTSEDESDAYFNPRHRILLEDSRDLTFTGWISTDQDAEVVAQLSWYPDTKGPSSEQTTERIELGVRRADGWTSFRLDADAPTDAVAVGAFLRLQPPEEGRHTLDIDDLALITWSPSETPPSPVYDRIDVRSPVVIDTAVRFLPGGRTWAQRTLSGDVIVPAT